MTDTRMRRSVSQYLEQRANENLSEDYMRHMQKSLKTFAAWCEEHDIKAVSKVTAETLKEYMQTLVEKGGSTQRVQWCILKAFLRWSGNRIADQFRYRARGPDRFKIRWLTIKQVNLLLSAPLSPLDRLIVNFGLYAGLRMREVLDMRVCEARTALTTGWLVVRGKGYKSRPVYLHDALKMALEDYLRMTDLGPSEKLIRFGDHQYDTHLRKVGKELGFVLSSHDLRRTHAAKMCEGQDMDVACISLGHQSTEVTQKYAGTQLVRLQRAIEHLDYSKGVQTPTRPVL